MKFLLSLCLFIPFIGNAQTINGTTTFAFNENAGGRPDGGSKVYAFRLDAAGMAVYDTINNFLTAKSYRGMNGNLAKFTTMYTDSADRFKGKRKMEKEYNAFMDKIAKLKTDADDRIKLLAGMGADSKKGFDSLDYRASKAVSKVRYQMTDVKNMTADGSGNFSFKLPPGKYAVLSISNNRTGFTTTEVYGRIMMKQVEVKEGETANVELKYVLD